MLPGFRFLFTAIVLSMSVLIFGLGAAALLRAAHEEFANLPARRTAPAPMFARPTDEMPPTLALLRIDTSVEEKPVKDVAAASIPEAAADTPAQAAPAPNTGAIEPEKLAAVKPAEPMQAEAATPETSAKEATVETPAPPVAAIAEMPAPPKAQAAATEVKLAAVAETPQPAAAPTAPPAPDIYSESNSAATRIATLGGPAVIVDEQTSAKSTEAKPDRNALKKQAAERARERRRIIAARRARIAREATLTLQQQQPNPFIQTPFAQDPIARTTR